MDDNLVTQNHPLTSKGLSTLVDIFSSTYYKDNLGYNFGYRPMVHLSFAIENAIFGESPVISHFINVLLYCFVVFLFYKLILTWLGEQRKGFAFVVALFFAVHPIHSEVVASIKNRDEILAFMFALLAALSMHQFISRKNLWKLLLVGLFFGLGMISKKSIFPLAFVFPIAHFLLFRPSLKIMMPVALVILVPTALIGGEGDWFKSGLIFSAPLIFLLLVIGFFHLTEQKTLVQFIVKKSKANLTLFLSIVAWSIVCVGVIKTSFILLLLSSVFFGFVFYRNQSIGFLQMVFLSNLVAFLYFNVDFLDFTLFFSLYFLIYAKNKVEKNYLVTCGVVTLILYFYLFFKLDLGFQPWLLVIQKIVMLSGLFALLRFKPVLGFIYAVLLYVFLIYFNWLQMAGAFTFFGIALLFKQFSKNNKFDFYIPLLSFIAVFVLAGFFSLKLVENDFKNTPIKIVQPTENFQQFNTEIKEGRNLEYVENTLVVPHTKSQTIGTGFLVLGEYARLLLFPEELSFYYGYSKIKTTDLYSGWVWISIFFYFGLLILALIKIKRNPIISIGILWYVACIILFSNWIELVAGMVGERLAFVSSAGFSIFIVSLFFWIKPTFTIFKPKKFEFFIGVILVVLAFRTMDRNSDWKSPLQLLGNDIEHLENSAQANNMYAMSLLDESIKSELLSEQEKIDLRKKAIYHLEKAIAIYPNFFNYNFDLGRAYITINDNRGAKNAFLQAYKILPNNLLALEELTKTSFDLGEKEATVNYGNQYLALNPNNENIHELVAYSYFLNKEYDITISYAKRGLDYYPNNQNLNQMIVDSMTNLKKEQKE